MDQLRPNSQNPYASPAIPREPERPPLSPSANKPNEPLVEPIHASGAISLADFYYAVRLRRHWLARFRPFLLVVPLLVVGWVWAMMNAGNAPDALLFLWALPFFAILAVLLLRRLPNWRLRKMAIAGKGIFAHTESDIYEDYCEIRQESATAKIMWSMYCKFRYSDRLVLLFYDGIPHQFGIIPRSKFRSQHDWECFIGLLDRKMPRC